MQTRVLVTHNVSFLPQIDKIIVLKEGTISEVSFVQHPFFVPTHGFGVTLSVVNTFLCKASSMNNLIFWYFIV